MARFTHDSDGTSESDWSASPMSGLPELDPPSATDTVVVVAAHPDDESLGAGGLIALAAAAGATIRVVIATDGEASHPRSRTHSRERLATVRREEVTAAMQALSPTLTPTFLGLPDGELAARIDDLSAHLHEQLSDASLVVTPWCGDGHPDHEACALATAQLTARDTVGRELRHWQYPIWAWHWARPDELPWPRMARLALDRRSKHAKEAAIAAHRSQHTALSAEPGDEPVVAPHVLTHFDRACEVFVVAASAPAAQGTYFDELYAESPDPWGLSERFYERRKREVVMASLPRERFARAFEPGCATGELTMRLANRCAEVVAWDGAAAAILQARGRPTDGLGAVTFAQHRIPDDWPAGCFDLVVLSEVAYYCEDLHRLTDKITASLTDDGVVLACHWRRSASDHPHTADVVHDALAAGLGRLQRVAHHEEPDFLLDVWSRDLRSVAQAEGIVT